MTLFILLSEDNIILLSETVTGLQTPLSSLYHAASDIKLKISMNKTNIIVFLKVVIWHPMRGGSMTIWRWKLLKTDERFSCCCFCCCCL